MIAVIDNFLSDVRERAKVRPRVTAEHVATIETALVRAYKAADNDPAYIDLWDDIAALIARRDLSVKDRLAGLRPIAEAFDEVQRGHSH